MVTERERVGERERYKHKQEWGSERKIVAQTGVGEREREPPKKRGMVGERKIGRETGGGRERERQPQRERKRDRDGREKDREAGAKERDIGRETRVRERERDRGKRRRDRGEREKITNTKTFMEFYLVVLYSANGVKHDSGL